MLPINNMNNKLCYLLAFKNRISNNSKTLLKKFFLTEKKVPWNLLSERKSRAQIIHRRVLQWQNATQW